MELYDYKIIYSVAVLVTAFFIRLLITNSLKKIQTKFDFQYLGASAKIKPLGSQA